MFSYVKKSLYITLFAILCTNNTFSHDILIEGKAALFLPTNQTFQDIYGKCGEYGFEITAEIVPHLYGFASFDFMSKSGSTEIFETPTKLYTNFFGIGLKYFMPTNFGDFYLGIGAEPTYLKTIDQSEYVQTVTTRWGFGGIAKVGAIVNLPRSLFFDIFVDYSFAHIDFTQPFHARVQSATSVLDGVLCGIGIGYRFN